MTTAILAVCIILLLLALVWYIAARLKRRIDAEGEKVYGVSRHVQITSRSVRAIVQFTPEPILVKRDEARVSLQVGEQPMKALDTVPDRGLRAALREAAVAVDAQFGPRWTAIVKATGATTLHVTRLA